MYHTFLDITCIALLLLLLLTTHAAAWFIISVDSVCLSVCLSDENSRNTSVGLIHVGSSYLHTQCMSRQYWPSSYMKVIGSRSKSQERQKVHNRYTQRMPACQDKSSSAQCENLIADNWQSQSGEVCVQRREVTTGN